MNTYSSGSLCLSVTMHVNKLPCTQAELQNWSLELVGKNPINSNFDFHDTTCLFGRGLAMVETTTILGRWISKAIFGFATGFWAGRLNRQVWNPRNCTRQTGSLSVVCAWGCTKHGYWKCVGSLGEEGATERLFCANLSLCKHLLCCVSLLFCTCDYSALESPDSGCIYIAFLRHFWLHLVVAFWVSIWIPEWVYPKPNKRWRAALGSLLCLGWSRSGLKVFLVTELAGSGSGLS